MSILNEFESSIDRLVDKKIDAKLNNIHIRLKELERVTLNDLSNAGTPWDDFEDQSFNACYKLFVEKMAAKHKRSVGAIESRIKQGLGRF